MKIELEVNVFNVKDGNLSEQFPEEFSWEVLDRYFKAEKMPSYGSMFYSPDSFVVWESVESPFLIDHSNWMGDEFSKEIIDLFINKKNWKQVQALLQFRIES